MIIDPTNLIICYKHKQSTGQRALGVVLPVLFWGILLYVLSTLFALGSSIIDYSSFGNWAGYEDILAIKKIMSRYFPVIGGCVGAFLLWVLYDTLRFAAHRNRGNTHLQPVSLEETAGFCRLETGKVRNMQQAKILTCLFDDNGNIVGIRHDAAISPVRKQRPVDVRTLRNDAVEGERIAA